jgi:glycosyltransferase involved in cell wall biosynthesis
MGSDVHGRKYIRKINQFMASGVWNKTIIKSKRMKTSLNCSKAEVIPNGVDMGLFKPIDKIESRHKTGFSIDKKIIVFIADPDRDEKNFELAKSSVAYYNRENPTNQAELCIVNQIEHQQVPVYINASDVVILTSKWEGSPNIIKEAMACNVPIVSTDVGDVKEIIGATEGCFVCKADYKEIGSAISRALKFDRTEGRIHITHLDSREISSKLVEIYKKLINDK